MKVIRGKKTKKLSVDFNNVHGPFHPIKGGRSVLRRETELTTTRYVNNDEEKRLDEDKSLRGMFQDLGMYLFEKFLALNSGESLILDGVLAERVHDPTRNIDKLQISVRIICATSPRGRHRDKPDLSSSGLLHVPLVSKW